ncbi:MAG: nucleotidyltransferase family protein [Pseudomonadota bacterium]
MAEVATILLAAGLSRRMGARNKLLLPIGDVPMIAHMVRTYLTATCGPLLLVTGHDADRVAAAVAGLGVRIVHNPDYASGQASSVACGLDALGLCDAVLIGLGDQPHLTGDNLSALMAAHQASGGRRVSIPTHNGQRGNPILVPRAIVPEMLADPHAPGCQRFTRTHANRIEMHDLPAPGFFRDIDTPADYAPFAEHAL